MSTEAIIADGSNELKAAASGGPIFGKLLLLAVTISSAATQRSLFYPFQELGKAALQLSDLQISYVQGIAAAIPIALLSVPLGRAVDRSNRVRLLIIMIVMTIAGTVLTAYAESFWMLFIARMLAGLGAVSSLPAAISIAADLSAPTHRGRSLLYLSLGAISGNAIAFALGGWLLALLTRLSAAGSSLTNLAPWREVNLVVAAGCALLLLPLLFFVEPARTEKDPLAAGSFMKAVTALWERRGLLVPLFIGQVTVTMADTAAGVWAAPVLSRHYHLEPSEFAGWMGLVFIVAGVVGSVVGAISADLSQKSGRPGAILIAAVIAAAFSIPASFFSIMPNALGFALMLALLMTAGGVTGVVTATAIAVLVPNELRGICLGAFMVVGGVIGLGLAPTLVTWVSTALGGESWVGPALSVTGATTSLMALIGFFSAMRSVRAIR